MRATFAAFFLPTAFGKPLVGTAQRPMADLRTGSHEERRGDSLPLPSLQRGPYLLNFFNRSAVKVEPAYGVVGLPAGVWVTMLVTAWVMFGLVGHDPWKADEAHTFGVVIDYLRHRDWVVPTLAGEPFVEKPPLFYIVSAASAYLFGGLLPLHDAARLASGFFVGIALLFLGLTARELFGRGYASATVVVFISCLGTFVRLHQIVTDVALLAGMAVGIFGLALARRTLSGASVALGAGATCAFLAKGLLGPGLLAVTSLLLPLFIPWRTRRYFASLGIAALMALIPAAIWMYALFVRSPELFREWLVINNLGRFFGFTRIGPHAPPGYYGYTLLWYAFPALPLAAYAAWTAWRRPDAEAARRHIQLPGLLAVVVASVLGLANDSRELYLLPLMLPISLLAAKGIGLLPAAGIRAMSKSAQWGFGTMALLIWLSWLTLVTGIPSQLQAMLLAYQPGFVPKVQWIHFALAACATLVTVIVLKRNVASSGSALTQWTLGLTLCWALLATLWMPYLNEGKSYRTMVRSLALQLPSNGCLASLHLGEPQRGLLVYFAQVTTVRLEVQPDAPCDMLLVQGWRVTGALPPSPDWTLVWEGTRPGDLKELYRLYRRDVAPGHVMARFPQ
jgi:4-amino-4-deoxy-L-arabinose transferase-like glycosyltransferase